MYIYIYLFQGGKKGLSHWSKDLSNTLLQIPAKNTHQSEGSENKMKESEGSENNGVLLGGQENIVEKLVCIIIYYIYNII